MRILTPLRAGFLLLGSLLALTSLQLPARASAPDAAECPTCCAQGGPKCVICSASCTVVDNAYDAGSGPCPVIDS